MDEFGQNDNSKSQPRSSRFSLNSPDSALTAKKTTKSNVNVLAVPHNMNVLAAPHGHVQWDIYLTDISWFMGT